MKKLIWHTVLILLVSFPVLAKVKTQAVNGFEIEHRVVINVDKKRLWKKIKSINNWWSKDHSYTGSADNLSFDLQLGGCFCENLTKGKLEHLKVFYIDTESQIKLSGALGPLQNHAVTGVMVWTLKEIEGKTELVWKYRVGGYYPGGLDKLSKAVDGVLLEQLLSLKSFAENLN